MGPVRKRVLTGVLLGLGLAASAAGCANLFHDLQIHRLWRLNRGDPISSDAYFSVPTPENRTGSAAAHPESTADGRQP
jgi:hypothetical protein